MAWSPSVEVHRRTTMRKYLFISALLGGPLLWASAVQAAPCVSATYDVYLASGFSCTVGNQTYSGFSLDAPANVNASSITVGPAPNAPADNFGLLFNTSNVVSAPPGTDITLDFTVTATGALINDASVTITGSTSGDGNIELTECL